MVDDGDHSNLDSKLVNGKSTKDHSSTRLQESRGPMSEWSLPCEEQINVEPDKQDHQRVDGIERILVCIRAAECDLVRKSARCRRRNEGAYQMVPKHI